METVLFPWEQLIVLFIGFVVPLVGYVLNKYAPWVDETVKAVVHVSLAAGAGAVYSAIEAGTFAWNNTTLQLILSAIVAALFAHNLLWKPANVNVKLGADTRSARV